MLLRKICGVLAVLGWLLGAPAGGQVVDERAASEAGSAPLAIYNGYLFVVQGSVDRVENLRFLIDTGQTRSSIDPRIAKRLESSTKAVQVFNIDKTVTASSVEASELTFAGEHFADARLIIEDLRYLRASGVPVDGILGLDYLSRSNFRLDLEARRIQFGGSSKVGGRSVPLFNDGICLKIPLQMDGKRLMMVADTGMKGIVFYQQALDSIAADYKVGRSITGVSIGGGIRYTPALAPRLEVSGQSLNREVYLVGTAAPAQLGGAAGYVGLAGLHARWIEFDFASEVLRWSN